MTAVLGSLLLPPPLLAAALQASDEEEIVPTGLEAADWVRAGVLIAVALLLAVMTAQLVRRVVGGAGSPGRTGVSHLVGRLAGIGVFAAGTVYALNTLGVRIGPLLGALGIVGIALAFALQDILQNFVAGVIIQARNPFRYGDQIASGDSEGTVEAVNFRSVVLRTVDGTRVVLPSATVLKDPIHNLTAFEHRRTTVTVGVADGTDLQHAAEVIEGATAAARGVLDHPSPEVLVEQLGESSVDFAVRYWHRPPIADMWRTRDQVLVGVYGALGRAGIEIPFPQRTITLQPSPVTEPDPAVDRGE